MTSYRFVICFYNILLEVEIDSSKGKSTVKAHLLQISLYLNSHFKMKIIYIKFFLVLNISFYTVILQPLTMITKISIEDFIKNHRKLPLFDIRTPSEFDSGHIPGAWNLPLFTDEDRVKVGTTYKQKSREEAILLGFDLVGPKWSSFIKIALQKAPEKTVCLHCWRGGMRSSAMAWALDFYGFNVFVIEGGYKQYRQWVLNTFEQEYPIIILGGMTGSHKTEILKSLKDNGEQIVDLEGLAHHHGSAYGSMNKNDQPSQGQFENELADALHGIDKNKRVWFEDESSAIGKVYVPKNLRRQMQSGPLVEVQLDLKERLDFLEKEYGVLDKDFLEHATENIRKRLGPDQTKLAIEAIKANRMREFIEIVLRYYDKSYRNCISKRDPSTVYPMSIDFFTPSDGAHKIIDFVSNHPEISQVLIKI